VLFRHTAGHPLFTVELLCGLQERGNLIQDHSGRWIEGPALDWETLPPRVEAVIAERFGRLPEDWQSILTSASVEGEEFTAEAVARVQALDEHQVVQWLSGPLSQQHRLVLGQGVERLGSRRLSRYRFRHFLFQKYLYGKLDPVRRADLHEAMGTALEALHGERAVEMAVPLARHFEEAGMTLKASEYLLQAGDRAARLFANQEAIAHYRRGIELVRTLPDTPQRDRMELALQLAVGVPLIAARGFSADELGEVYGRARELARRTEASFELFQALSGIKSYYDVRGELESATQLGKELLRLARELDDPGLIAMAHHHQSTTLLYLGQPLGFLEQRERMSALYDAQRDRPLVYRLSLDAHLTNMHPASLAYWFLGYPDQARRLREEAVGLAREWEHPFLLAFTLMFAAFSSVYGRDVRSAREKAEETIAVATEHGHPLWLGGGMATKGWALAEEGELDEGIAHIVRGRAMVRAIQAVAGYLQMAPLLAETYRKAGRVREGLAAVDEALALIQATGYGMDEPEEHRLKGELLLMQGGAETQAEACFRRAVEVARRQQARSWELRATMSLARLWQRQDKVEQARKALAEIYGWFTEGFATRDLQEAKALLDKLS
jgi:predicted ATPase